MGLVKAIIVILHCKLRLFKGLSSKGIDSYKGLAIK